MSQQPHVTVVIPTFRRPASLLRLLQALAEQSTPFRWDVVVVDNDATVTAGTAAAVAAFEVNRPGIGIVAVSESTRGPAAARNRGIAAASGEVLAFLDDDVVPEPGWLEVIAGTVLAAPDVAGVTGKLVLNSEVHRPRWLDEHAIGGYFGAHHLGDVPGQLDGAASLILFSNAAFRRDALQSVGGFDPAFGPRLGQPETGEDARLTRALHRGGHRMRWQPAAVVVHELPAARLRLGWLLRRAWWQGRSDWRLERLDLLDRRAGGVFAGLRQVVQWSRQELAARSREGLTDPAVAIHAGCDLIRMAGRTWAIGAELRGRVPAGRKRTPDAVKASLDPT